jgi:hypothetical protein
VDHLPVSWSRLARTRSLLGRQDGTHMHIQMPSLPRSAQFFDALVGGCLGIQGMTDDHIAALLKLADRLVTLAENRWGVTEEVPRAEIWQKGDPGPKAETAEEYRNLPANRPGRFADLVTKHRTPGAG